VKGEKAPAGGGARGTTAEHARVNPVWSRVATQLQTKLTLSAPDDPYEREAEQTADRVMRMPETLYGDRPSPLSVFPARALSVQRKCSACEEEEEKIVQRKCSACEEEEEKAVHRKADMTKAPRSSPDAAVRSALASPGQPLDLGSREYFESRFGADFSRVRVHTDSHAANAATALNAKAFTVGPNIAFAGGQYAPASAHGRRLIAHELTHVAQQGHAPAIRAATSPVVARASGTPSVQKAGDDPDLLSELQARIEAANADAGQDDDVLRRAHGARLAFLYKYIAHQPLTSQQVLDDFVARMEKRAKTELDTLTDPANPFTAAFALEKIPKGFPLTWAVQVRFALSMGVDFATLVKEWQESYNKLASAAATLSDEIFAHGLPIPLDEPERLQNFKLRIADSKAPDSNAVALYAREAIAYVKLRWMSTFVASWEKFVDAFSDSVRDGDVVVNPTAYKDWTENRQAKFLELPERVRARIAMTEEEVKQIESDVVSFDRAATTIGMASGFLSILGIIKGWQEASGLFDAALGLADKKVAGASGGMRIQKAMKWAWDNGYYRGAAKQFGHNLIQQAPETLKEIGKILLIGLIGGEIPVAIYLAFTIASDVLHMIDELGSALNDCVNATTVAELQIASIRLTNVLVNGAIFILVVLVTEGVGKAAAKLRGETEKLMAADKHLTEEAARKKAMDKLSKSERAALESGAARMAKKFAEEIGEACALGSIICRAKLPDHIEAEAGVYPKKGGVPKPPGPYNVQKAALSGVDRSPQLLRDEVLANPKQWTPEFTKALADAKKNGLAWPVDAAGKPWEVHHVKPVFMGGTSIADNLMPLPKAIHQEYTNWWNAVHRAFRKRFTDTEWSKIYEKSTQDIGGSTVRKTPVP
jgi:hypothetical protein